VATLLWVSLALTSPAAVVVTRTIGVQSAVPLLVAAAVCLLYFTTTYYPVTTAAGEARQALNVQRESHESGHAGFVSRTRRRAGMVESPDGLRGEILAHFERALKADPNNAWLHTQLANWYAMMSVQSGHNQAVLGQRAITLVERAEALNEQGIEPCSAHHQILMLFGESSEALSRQRRSVDTAAARKLEADARSYFAGAAKVLERHVPFSPRDPMVRYQLAKALFLGGDTSSCAREAAMAEKLNHFGGTPAGANSSGYILSQQQIKQLQGWRALAGDTDPLADPPSPR
jgi:tetratricopeptide (TPR) repeat protein